METVASIPYERRVLLLPKCLSNSAKCQAEIDELGLLCHRCSHCSIPDLQDKAESLGIMSIVAEGFTSVVGLIQNRVVDSVIVWIPWKKLFPCLSVMLFRAWLYP